MGIYIPNMSKSQKVDGIKIDFHFEDGRFETHIIGIEEIIDIVTCGECKHWYNDADCGMACEFTNMGQPINGFCSYGERRGE